jgi:hypothetical protein
MYPKAPNGSYRTGETGEFTNAKGELPDENQARLFHSGLRHAIQRFGSSHGDGPSNSVGVLIRLHARTEDLTFRQICIDMESTLGDTGTHCSAEVCHESSYGE